ncbi:MULTISPECIES: NAD(P)-binding domain-containing protein [Streptomyces]|uniref:NAD(P)-binding domain-containing protein n=1 Tax=Streptomyces koelreuteriae TaxID=2838015 RepID=A0ABX8FWN6_9ACTN|nr:MULTISPECIES: NAD(P)-binding domain-containing protein [Streptomyces]QWB25473.1 NAD(P)-binding domain-containing protein [Streptomyces koelreuteriae]UUA08517.1 NAD(P)-binding domain-containing protein [Streptomyces koelreuteriae]UUA16122.1 NAD(P)-binding domain-containing protein [Streptomyces sp. CRCS-T-1]
MVYDLLVVGAGPYGLSIASHAAAAGLNLRVFGRPMASWRDNMPRGMFLKSEPWASNLSDPAGRWRLDVYCAEQGLTARHAKPIPVEAFARYGLWFARNAVPGVDERMVTRVSAGPGGFTAVAEDGEEVHARAVALAVGVMPFVEVPQALRGLHPALVTHSSHHSDLDRFRGKDVTVIGGGQAALETAALLAEQGTRVRVLARAEELVWNDVPPPWERPWWQSARSPHSGLGPGWRNWFYAERPGLFRRLPEPTRARIATTALGPAGAWWVRDRVEGVVELLPGHEVAAASAVPGGVRLDTVSRTGAPRSLETEHVIAATGFRARCDRLGLLAPELRGSLAALPDGSPEVGHGFESSHPGLFLAGLVTASGFGPAMRFVQGAAFTASTLVAGVRRRLGAMPVAGTVPAPVDGNRSDSPAPVRH